MFTTVEDFHKYMDQLYEVAVQNRLRNFCVNIPKGPISPERILMNYRTPENEPIHGCLVGKDGENLIYVVKW